MGIGSSSYLARQGFRGRTRTFHNDTLQQIVMRGLLSSIVSYGWNHAHTQEILAGCIHFTQLPTDIWPSLPLEAARARREQLLVHLGVNQLLSEHQSAYRRLHSTETALLKVTSDVLLAADQGMVTLLEMLDLIAAFDCVDHHILLRRLRISYGITEVVLELITSYLTGR